MMTWDKIRIKHNSRTLFIGGAIVNGNLLQMSSISEIDGVNILDTLTEDERFKIGTTAAKEYSKYLKSIKIEK